MRWPFRRLVFCMTKCQRYHLVRPCMQLVHFSTVAAVEVLKNKTNESKDKTSVNSCSTSLSISFTGTCNGTQIEDGLNQSTLEKQRIP